MSDAVARLNTALEGRYRVERQIGEGGMATVYLAHDLRHGRQVALKVLKPELAAVVGAERFLAEIRTTAQLQHPHILPLFDSGEAASFLFYVMPFVAGETLRERLDREKQLPVHEAIQIASSVAHALQHAHDRGVIHRDIKPANILMQDGQPVVSDFGIALAVGAGGGARLTETGLSVGTSYYMSPEQATGDQQIGPPSDIYSLGAVLYEMLTGEPPYTGSTAQAVLGRIIQGAPVSATEVRKSVPANVNEAINMALERLPADRFSGAQDFARALGDPSFRHGGQSGARVDEVASTAWRRRWVAAVAFAGVSTLAAAWGWLRPMPPPAPATYDVGVSDTVPMHLNMDTRAFTVSPTGDFLVYVARRDSTTELWYRSLTSAEARPIPGTRGAWGTPMLSSDGGRVLFALGTQVRLGPVAGGAAPTTVADILNIPYSDLGSTDRTRYVDGSVLRTVDLVSGELVEDLPIDCMLPWTLADGRRALCGGGGVKFGTVVDLGSGETRPLSVAGNDSLRLRGSDFRVVDDDYVLFVSLQGDLKAAPFDQRGEVVGRSITVLPGVRTENYSGRGQYQVTSDGTLYYLPGLHHQVSRLVRAGPTGEVTALPVKPAAFLRMALSPDGRSLAAVVEGVQSQELRIYDLQTGLFSVWLEGEGILQPVWSPAGDLVLVQSLRADGQGDVLLGSPASTSPPDVVATVPGFFWPIAYRADSVIVGSSGSALYALDARTVPATIDSLGEGTIMDRMSPDRRWLASPDQDGGISQGIRLEPWPSRDRVYRLPGAGDFGAWVSSGEFVSGPDYASGVRFFRTPFNTASQSPIGEPAFWFEDLQFTQGPSASFVTTPEGGIIYLQALEGGVEHFIRVIPGWVDQMKRMVDGANRG